LQNSISGNLKIDAVPTMLEICVDKSGTSLRTKVFETDVRELSKCRHKYITIKTSVKIVTVPGQDSNLQRCVYSIITTLTCSVRSVNLRFHCSVAITTQEKYSKKYRNKAQCIIITSQCHTHF
jgi:hypothetical protein